MTQYSQFHWQSTWKTWKGRSSVLDDSFLGVPQVSSIFSGFKALVTKIWERFISMAMDLFVFPLSLSSSNEPSLLHTAVTPTTHLIKVIKSPFRYIFPISYLLQPNNCIYKLQVDVLLNTPILLTSRVCSLWNKTMHNITRKEAYFGKAMFIYPCRSYLWEQCSYIQGFQFLKIFKIITEKLR